MSPRSCGEDTECPLCGECWEHCMCRAQASQGEKWPKPEEPKP